MNMAVFPTLTELADALRVTNFLSDENVQRRARLLHEELARLQIQGFCLLPPRVYPGSDFRPEVRVAEYKFGPVPFGLENARDPSSVGKTVVEMGGTALDKEDILYLSKVCEMAREILPRPWNNDQALIKDLRLASKHLDTLNEIWWLGRWSGLTDLRREVTILESSSKTVDWSFKVGLSESWTINLEVKRLIGSLGARVYGKDHHFYTAVAVDGSPNKDDPRRKFRSSLDHEINVLAATWFDEISADLEKKVQQFLDEDDRIDAVLLWAPGDRRRGGWMQYFPRFREVTARRRVLATVLQEPDEEDHSRIIAFAFPRTLQSIREEMESLARG